MAGARARIEHLTTSGPFSLDCGVRHVDNNVWIIGDDTEALVVDAAHDAAAIVRVLAGRALRAIVCTHAHRDHIDAAVTLAEHTAAPVLLHADDLRLWRSTHPGRPPDGGLSHGQVLAVAGEELTVLHTPGHTSGGVCLYAGGQGTVFTGDTLLHGEPGPTGRPFADFPTLVGSIRDRLLTLPPQTAVRPGHGASTTIGEEGRRLAEWIARGH